jgi:hypothetical protein
MDRKRLIDRLVNRKLASATKVKRFCICAAGPGNAAPKK